jgi:diketogulonate reductase-like aldo/keto reductase
MVWQPIVMNDGNKIPGVAYGTWKTGNGQPTIDQAEQAISVGFSHIDTAQLYRNEAEAGTAIRESGLARNEIFVTTKYSALDGADILTSIQNSLTNLGLEYVDLYLIHHPVLAKPDIETAWKVMEHIKEKGWAKSIGVSNFGVNDLAILLSTARITPAANQILLHPYVYLRQLPILDYCRKHNIVIEGYSPLIPITQRPGGVLDPVINGIATRLGATPDQVLLAWVKSKQAVAVTSSSKLTRLQGYIAAGSIELKPEEIDAIDKAGAIGAGGLTDFISTQVAHFEETGVGARRVALAAILSAIVLCTLTYYRW